MLACPRIRRADTATCAPVPAVHGSQPHAARDDLRCGAAGMLLVQAPLWLVQALLRQMSNPQQQHARQQQVGAQPLHVNRLPR